MNALRPDPVARPTLVATPSPLLELACHLSRVRKQVPGHWRLVRWLNGRKEQLRRLPPRARSLGHGQTLFIDPSDYDGLRYLVHGVTPGDPIGSFLSQVLAPGDGFVDVGANVGIYSLIASRHVGDAGRVLAIEASPATFEKLRVVESDPRRNIVARHCAVADAVGVTSFFIGPGDHSGMSSLRDLGTAATQRISVPTETLDRLLADWEQVRLIKIDVEGAELGVLRGAAGVIDRHRPVLLLELTPAFLETFGDSVAALLGFMAGRGYACRRLAPDLPAFEGLVDGEFQCDVVFLPPSEADAPARRAPAR